MKNKQGEKKMSKLAIAMFSELIDCNSREVNLYLKDHYEKKVVLKKLKERKEKK